jgi:hypothetical protein
MANEGFIVCGGLQQRQTYLHGTMAAICNAAFVCHAVAGCDPLCRNFSYVLRRARLLAEGQIDWRLELPHGTSRAPGVRTSLLDNQRLRRCIQQHVDALHAQLWLLTIFVLQVYMPRHTACCTRKSREVGITLGTNSSG